jgi:hypothetical protein
MHVSQSLDRLEFQHDLLVYHDVNPLLANNLAFEHDRNSTLDVVTDSPRVELHRYSAPISQFQEARPEFAMNIYAGTDDIANQCLKVIRQRAMNTQHGL